MGLSFNQHSKGNTTQIAVTYSGGECLWCLQREPQSKERGWGGEPQSKGQGWGGEPLNKGRTVEGSLG